MFLLSDPPAHSCSLCSRRARRRPSLWTRYLGSIDGRIRASGRRHAPRPAGQRGGRPMSGRMRTGQVTAGPSREAAYGVALSQEVKVTDRPVTQQVGRCGITSSFQAFSSVSTKLLVSVLLCVCVQHASHSLRGHSLTFGWRCQTSLVRGSFTSFV